MSVTTESVVRNVVEKYHFEHLSELSRKEFIEMMTEILEKYPESNHFKEGVGDFMPHH